MTLKSILCVFNGSQNELNALNTALILAKAHAARLRILHISPDPQNYAGIYGEGILLGSGVMDSIEKENAQLLSKAKEYAVTFASKHHIPLDAAEPQTHHASARFQHVTGMTDAVIAREGRLSDLIVISRDTSSSHDLITPAIFDTGRPVLAIPPVHGDMPGEWQNKTVSFAWNGSLQAARALFNALPLLRRTEKMYLLSVEKYGRDLEATAGLMEYLHAHDIKTQGIIVSAGTLSTSEALLTRARELKSDMLVMGAYGHSMFREMVLGGVTEYMLQKADLPVLLSH